MIVGGTDVFDNKGRALALAEGAAPLTLGEPAGYTDSAALGLGGDGTAVGWVSQGGLEEAAIWTPGEAPAALDQNGLLVARALDVNNARIAVGYAGGGADPARPMLWVPGEAPQELPTFGVSEAIATGINDAGQVVGASLTTGDAEQHLVRWSEATRIEDLGSPDASLLVPADHEVHRRAGPKINSQGQVALFETNLSGGEASPWIWTDADGFTLLPSFPPDDGYGTCRSTPAILAQPLIAARHASPVSAGHHGVPMVTTKG